MKIILSNPLVLKAAGLTPRASRRAACGGIVTPGGQNAGATGAACGAVNASADSMLQHCSVPPGTIAVDDGRNAEWWGGEGSSRATHSGAMLAGFGGNVGGGSSGFSTSPEGKATAVAFVGAWNELVVAVRNYKAQDVKGGFGRGGQLQVN
ncbi:hypothetical protein WS86_15360 [Burkholderia savannae]|nr:hypothetical protein WS86_15360 [Burkholderia savannae]